MTTLTQLLTQSEKLSGEATKGPWKAEKGTTGYIHAADKQVPYRVLSGGNGPVCTIEIWSDECDNADSEFIAHARNVLPLYTEALRVAMEALERVPTCSDRQCIEQNCDCEGMIARNALATLDRIAQKAGKHE